MHYVGFSSSNTFLDGHQAFLSLKGIHILNGVNIYSCQNIIIDSCLIERTGSCVGSEDNISKTAVYGLGVANFTIKNSDITKTATGVSVKGENIQILNNVIHDITHDGIKVMGSRNSLIEGNNIYNLDDGVEDGEVAWNRHCDAIHVFIMGSSIRENLIANENIVFRGNTLYNCESQGLQFNTYYAFPDILNTNLVFENNIFGPTRANRFNCPGNSVDTLIFRHNTFLPEEEGYTFTSGFREVNCDNGNTIRIEKNQRGLEIYNNILPTLPNVSDTHYCDYNLYYNMTSSSPVSRNSVVDTNIKLLNPGSFDGKLMSTSPAVNAGTIINAPSGIYDKDFYGTLRDKRPDMGACELAGQSPDDEESPTIFDDEKTIFVDDFEDGNLFEDLWLQAANTQGLSWNRIESISETHSLVAVSDFDDNGLSGPYPNGKALIFSEQGNNWADYTFEFDAFNAYVTENDGAVFLAKDTNNYYWLDISRDNGRLVRYMVVNKIVLVDTLERSDAIQLPHTGIREYKILVSHTGNQIGIEVDADRDNSIDFSYTETDTNAIKIFSCGKIGFKINHSNGYTRAIYDNIKVEVSNFCEVDTNDTTDTTITSLVANNEFLFNLYPNPCTDYLIISINRNYTYTITDRSGRVLKTGYAEPTERLDISGLSSGLYILTINNSQEVLTSRFVKY